MVPSCFPPASDSSLAVLPIEEGCKAGTDRQTDRSVTYLCTSVLPPSVSTLCPDERPARLGPLNSHGLIAMTPLGCVAAERGGWCPRGGDRGWWSCHNGNTATPLINAPPSFAASFGEAAGSWLCVLGSCQGCSGSHLGAQVCPPHLAGVSSCAAVGGPTHRFVCTGTTGDPRTPKPTQGLALHGHAQVLSPSLVNTCSHQCWNWSPRHSAVPSRSVLGCSSGMGTREGLGASLSALSIGAGSRTPWHRHLPGSQIPAPGPPQGPAGPLFGLELWEASSVPWVSPALVLQCGFSVVGKFPRMPCHEPPPQHSEELQWFSVTLCCPSGRVPRLCRAVTRWVTMRSFY